MSCRIECHTEQYFSRDSSMGTPLISDGILRGIAGQAIAGNRFVAFDLILRDLQGKSFRSLFENALRLLGALEQIADLPRGCHLDGKLLA